jgi:hypothetical protein
MSKTTLKAAKPLDTDPAALERRKTTSRLRRSRLSLEAFLFRLETLHADKSGAFRMMYPATPLLIDEAEPKYKSVARTKREASLGCDLCAAWIEETATLRERIEVLRNTKLPEKAPDYSGPWILPHWALSAGKVRPRSYLQDRPRPDVAVLLAEQEERRAERKAKQRAFLDDFVRETEEAAQAKAAANVPH